MAKISLFKPPVLNQDLQALQAFAIEHALDTIPNVGIIEGGIRIRVRKAVLRNVESSKNSVPDTKALQEIVGAEQAAACEHPFLGGSAEGFATLAGNLRRPDRAADRLDLIAKYTIVRMFELGMYDQPENAVLTARRDEITAHMIALMAERVDPMEALKIALADGLSRAPSREKKGVGDGARVSKIAAQIHKRGPRRSRGNCSPSGGGNH